ncbi:hypothetical protein NC997_19740 [Trichocoleus sp. DQ-A2]|uniref:hypothetical protein n=1 Tax=Cyanophyceae TaxID=3028117 RepID=UPI0016891F31|nr:MULTISPECIES: hypothetical protein [unclassified Coleofasciculus]MBD1837330.1 hypothetical protein [Coleofasciculus sp. FACHB-501]MBD1899193.1 hypothetical protein [Coleofasciculus sp. FACHB-125]MBD1945379.1 hypothetical protein [Coleofasciculus sp. FACHB-712]
MAPQNGKIRFPLWQFLNQPLFSSKTKLVLNPRRFSYCYRIHLLERCWVKDYQPGNRRQH